MPDHHALAAAGVARLSHVSVTVEDVDAAVDWWTRIFGFQEIMRLDLSGPDFEAVTATPGATSRMVRGLVAPGMVLQFFSHDWREPTSVGALLSFEVRDVQRAYAELVAAGVECQSAPVEFDNSTAFTAVDPHGIALELIQWAPSAEPYVSR
jgi:catechol 2,3-dioxygenase-like lactoylglutathione lyase family enzyme